MLNGLLEFIPEIQIADATEAVTDWLTDTFSFIFDPINKYFGNFMEFVAEDVLIAIPPVIFIILVALLAFFVTGKKWGLAVFSIVGLWLIYNQGHWDDLMNTVTLVLLLVSCRLLSGFQLVF